MNTIDKTLDNLVKEVEIYGRSGGDCIYLTNVSFTIEDKDFEVPIASDIDGAVVDFDWFMRCSKRGMSEPHPSPDKSFWLRFFGQDAVPYGMSWNFQALRDHLTRPDNWRKCVLFNPRSADNPPCILSYQFISHDTQTLDVIVSMRSSDVSKVLPQDVLMTWFLLKHVCEENNFTRGSITFQLANAHVYYEDCVWQDEFEIDGLD